MSGTQTGFFDSLLGAIQENPLAAALIGGGAFWLLAGDDRLKSAARATTAAVSPMVETGARGVRSAVSGVAQTAAWPAAPDTDEGAMGSPSDSLRGASNAASDALSGAADSFRDRLDEGASYARERLGKPGKEAFAKAQSSLAELLEQQPLVLGAVGLAIGAALAGGFQASNVENQLFGQLSDDVKADLNVRAGAVSRSLREAADTVKAEVGDTAAEAVDRIKQAGVDAAGAARESTKST